jgi:hypothetical protein
MDLSTLKKPNRSVLYITLPDQFNVFLYLYSLCSFLITFLKYLLKFFPRKIPPFFSPTEAATKRFALPP